MSGEVLVTVSKAAGLLSKIKLLANAHPVAAGAVAAVGCGVIVAGSWWGAKKMFGDKPEPTPAKAEPVKPAEPVQPTAGA